MPDCVHCARPIQKHEIICPHCGGEQPAPWMVNLVYLLSFLFVQGAVFRLIWPNLDSLKLWLGWLAASAVVASVAGYLYKRFRVRKPSRHSNDG